MRRPFETRRRRRSALLAPVRTQHHLGLPWKAMLSPHSIALVVRPLLGNPFSGRGAGETGEAGEAGVVARAPEIVKESRSYSRSSGAADVVRNT